MALSFETSSLSFREKNILKVVCVDFSPDSYRESEMGSCRSDYYRLAERPISKGETHERVTSL